jgi:hypothetical protein
MAMRAWICLNWMRGSIVERYPLLGFNPHRSQQPIRKTNRAVRFSDGFVIFCQKIVSLPAFRRLSIIKAQNTRSKLQLADFQNPPQPPKTSNMNFQK